MSTGGTSDKIGLVGEAPGINADEKLGVFGHHVDGAIGVVDELFGMAFGEGEIVTVVAGVVAGSGIVFLQCQHHGAVGDGAGVAAIANTFEFAVPDCGVRDPNFELDFGIWNRVRGRLDAAERWQGIGAGCGVGEGG